MDLFRLKQMASGGPNTLSIHREVVGRQTCIFTMGHSGEKTMHVS